jgi:hypothetical protein
MPYRNPLLSAFFSLSSLVQTLFIYPASLHTGIFTMALEQVFFACSTDVPLFCALSLVPVVAIQWEYYG